MKTTIAILAFFLLFFNFNANAFYAHVYGPNFTCPDSELIYYYDDDYGWGIVTWTITYGKVFNELTQTWVTSWTFDRSQYPYLSSDFPFRIKWDNASIGQVGNVHINVCDGLFPFICSNGDRNVTFGPSPGTPVISGSNSILSCTGERKSYSAVNIPEGWSLSSWSLSSNIKRYGSGNSPITIEAQSTTSQGAATLTGNFVFTTDGNTCGTKNVPKSIWLGKPEVQSKTVNGSPYSYGSYAVCPGNNWVGVTWNGLVSSVSWSVTPGITYYPGTNELDFYFPYSGYSAVSISVNATNTCGTSYNSSYYLSKKTFGCGSYLVTVYPNPSSDELNIEISSDKLSVKESDLVPKQIFIVDESNTIIHSSIPQKSSARLDIRNIPDGIYYLHIVIDKNKVVERILIKKQ